VQPKINLQSFKSTPDSLKQHLTALERKRSLGAPGIWLAEFYLFGLNKLSRIPIFFTWIGFVAKEEYRESFSRFGVNSKILIEVGNVCQFFHGYMDGRAKILTPNSTFHE